MVESTAIKTKIEQGRTPGAADWLISDGEMAVRNYQRALRAEEMLSRVRPSDPYVDPGPYAVGYREDEDG